MVMGAIGRGVDRYEREETERVFRNAELKQRINAVVNSPDAVVDSCYEDEHGATRTFYIQVRMPC